MRLYFRQWAFGEFLRRNAASHFQKLCKGTATHFIDFSRGNYRLALGGKFKLLQIERRSSGFGKVPLGKLLICRSFKRSLAGRALRRSGVFSVGYRKPCGRAFRNEKGHFKRNFLRLVLIQGGKTSENLFSGGNILVGTVAEHIRRSPAGKISVGEALP